MISAIIGNICSLANDLNSKRGQSGSSNSGNADKVSNVLSNFIENYGLV